MNFYNQIANFYDEMTSAPERKNRISSFVETFYQRYRPKTILDAACGTGSYTIAWANRGIQAVGVDISEKMLDQARQITALANPRPKFIQTPIQNLTDHLNTPFDAIFCLGNSLPYLLTDQDLNASLTALRTLLNPHAPLLIQFINYPPLIEKNQRVLAVNRRDNVEYIRFYDFLDNLINFNLLRIDWQTDQPQHQLHTTPMRPYSPEQIIKALMNHGFTQVSLHGSLDFEPFQPDSPSVVIEARK